MQYEITKPRTVVRFDVRIVNRNEFNSHYIHVARIMFPRLYKKAHVDAGNQFIYWARRYGPKRTGRLHNSMRDIVGNVSKYPYSFVLIDAVNPKDGFPYPWALNFAPEGRYTHKGKPTNWWFMDAMGRARPSMEREFRYVLEITQYNWDLFNYGARK